MLTNYIVCDRCHVKRHEEVVKCPVCIYRKELPSSKKNVKGKTISRRQWLRDIDARVQIMEHTKALLQLFGVSEEQINDNSDVLDYYYSAINTFIE